MERLQKPQERRERTGIVQIVLIAAVLLAALYGGLRLLGGTRAAWEARKAEKAMAADAIRRAAAGAQVPPTIDYPEPTAAKREAREAVERSRQLQSEKLRCINGQLFRRLPNGWENIPNEKC